MTTFQIIGLIVVALLGLYVFYCIYDLGRSQKTEDRRKNKNKALTMALLIVALFAGQNAWAQITWSVTSSTSGNVTTFTITRLGSYLPEQIVGYRTISLSAIEGQHFYAANDTLIFREGWTSRSVTVTEKTNPSGMYKYQEGTTRSYRFEVYDHNGGYLAHVDRSMTTGSSVASTAFQEKTVNVQTSQITVTDAGYAQAYYAVPLSTYFNNTAPQAYFTALNVQLRMLVTFDAREKSDGYQYIQIIHNNTTGCDTGAKDGDPGTIRLSRYMAGFTIDGNVSSTFYPYTFPLTSKGSGCGAVTHPWPNNSNGNLKQQYFNTNCRATDGRLIIPTNLNTLGIRFDASGNLNDDWYAKNVKAKIQAIDGDRPTISTSNIVVSEGIYKKGNTVYVSIPFSEIVVITGTPSLSTTWGTFNYFAGSGSNVLTFSGTISDNASLPFRITAISVNNNKTIKDRSGNAFNSILDKEFSNKTVATTYDIAYTLGSGTMPGGLSNPTTYCNQSLDITLVNPEAPTGYHFTGWTGSNGNTPQTTVTIAHGSTGNRNYTANISVNTYTVHFDKNATSATGAMADQQFTYGQAQHLTANAFVFTGHTFQKWNTSADGSGTDYTDGQEVSNLSAIHGDVVNLYAQWPIDPYTISYELNGGTLPSGVTNPTNYTVESGIITLNNPIRLGFRFDGWTGSNGNTPQTTVTITPGSMTGNLNYIANWTDVWNVGGGADGSEGNPYMISSTAGLDLIASLVNSGNLNTDMYFSLANDITYSYDGLGDDESNFTPIGTGSLGYSFNGHFFGNGHRISGIRIRRGSENYQGLFGFIYDGYVENIILDDAVIVGKDYTGGIAGYTTGGTTIENCTVNSNVTIHASELSNYHGGIAGSMKSSMDWVGNCISLATLTAANTPNTQKGFGGIVGYPYGRVHNCIAYGVTIPSLSNCGAIIGDRENGTALTYNHYIDCHVGDNTTNIGTGTGDVSGAQKAYAITINNPEQGTISVSGVVYYNNNVYSASGKLIDLSTSINNPILEVDYYTVNGTPIDGTVFAMPAENTTVSAVLKQICPQPTDLTVTAIGDQTADITWNTSDLVEVTDWQICLNDDEEHLIDVHSTTKAYQLTGLTNDMYYTVKIRSVCSEGKYSEWSDDEAFEPTNKIIVGSGSNWEIYLPTRASSNFSLTQQIYDPSELGTAGDIESIAFYSLSYVTRYLDIYMKHTNKTVFQTTSDWENFSSADLVFSGEVSFVADQWTTITFDDVFVYDGISHVVLVVDDNTGDGEGEVGFKVFNDVTTKDLHFSSSDDLNATNIYECMGWASNCRNQLRVSKVAHSDCLKPRNFTATDITAHTAVLDWTESGASTQWVVSYNGTEVTVNTHPYTLQNLNSATKYNVKVRPACGENLWSSTISFTTIESCLKPTDFVANTVTNNSATLSWTENNGASNWQLIVDYDINHLINISSSVVTTNGQTVSYTLTGLESERSYTVMVRACCNEQDQSIWSDAIKFEPTNKLIVGNGTSNSSHLPTHCFYKYSLTQQIYTTQELGDTGYYIEGIDFQNLSNAERYMDIYIVSIDKEKTAFSYLPSGKVSVTDADRVFSGSVSFTQGAWTYIKFDNSYYYDGNHNIVLVVDDNSGGFSGSSGFLAFSASDQAIYVYSDKTDYDPTDPSGYSFGSPGQKNCIRILTNSTTCGRPQQLVVSDITSHGATFTWDKEDGDAFQYGVASANTPESGFNPSNSTNENTVTLDNLTPERQYVFYIRKDCGNSDYSKYTTFYFSTLESCYAPTEVYTDDITNSSVTVNWTDDNDSYAVSYRTAAHLGSAYVERFDSSSLPLDWSSFQGRLNDNGTVDLVNNDLWKFQEDHDVFDNHAVGNIYDTHSWWLVTPGILINGEFGLQFDLAYTCYNESSTEPDLNGFDDRFMVLVSMDDMKHWTKLREWNNSGSFYVLNEISTTGQQEFINLSAYDGSKVYIAFYIESVYNNADNNVHIDNVSFGGLEGGGPWQTIVSATTASSLDITNLTSNTQYEIKIQGNCSDNGLSHEVYTTFTTEPSCYAPKRLSCYNIMPRSVDLSWMSDADAWQICFNGDENNLVEANSNPFTLSGLTPETQYTVKVRAVCGDNEYGNWSDVISFTTDVPYPKPAELTVSAVHSTGATITWKGVGDSYELQYAKLVNSSKGLGDTHKYSFDDETLNGWTTIDADGDGNNWVSANRIINSYSDYSYGGQGCCVASQSYINSTHTVLTPDNYLVSPQILLGGSISFYACATDAEYPSEHFGVAVSLNSNDKASDFNTIQEWTMTAKNRSQGSWYEFTVDLSDYDGSLGYVAIRHFNVSDMFYLQVDEITLVEGGNNLGWVQASNATSPFLLNGLDPNSYYYVRVKANYANNMESPWSNASIITTAPGSIKVDGYGKGNGGWAFIATPVADGSNPNEVSNLIADPINNYDLYRLNPSFTMWENYKNTSEHVDFTTLVNGQGYLYANKNDVTLSFSGTYNTADSKEVELDQGFNLVGNPFAVPAYVNRSYYRMNAEGTDVEAVAAYTTTSIPACTGVVVKADGQDEKVTFSTTAPVSSNGNNGDLQLTLSQTVAIRGGTTSQITDKAIVSFNEGSRLAKYIFRENNAKLYFTQDGEDYAIAYSNGQDEMPLNFKARENGDYVLNFSGDVIARSAATKQSTYIHLIDNLTGIDVDLLQTPSYTFTARYDDYASRFRLVFSANDNDNEAEDFAFISNGEIIVNGTGTVQVIDMLGRQLFSKEKTSDFRLPTSDFSSGVYVLRLIDGQNVKTQKIVIK